MSPAPDLWWKRAMYAISTTIEVLAALFVVGAMFYACATAQEAHDNAPANCLKRGGQIVTNSSGGFAQCIERPAGSSTRETQP